MAGGDLPTLDHAGWLEDRVRTPGFLVPGHEPLDEPNASYSCSYCGVGDSGRVVHQGSRKEAAGWSGAGPIEVEIEGVRRTIEVAEDGSFEVPTDRPLTAPGGVLTATATGDGPGRTLTAREVDRRRSAAGLLEAQRFVVYQRAAGVKDSSIAGGVPTSGCVKFKVSMMRQRSTFPIQVAPSELDRSTGRRRSLTYAEGIARLADLLLAHRQPAGKTLVYATGQLDYFTIFAMQEVFRLLGIRNMTGNAEHCLNSGAVHNEVLTGQEGPFLTLEQAVEGPDRFYLLNGWNGFVTHPPAFARIQKRKDLDAYLIEVQVTESARLLARRLGPERVLLIRPRSDPQLALAVGHRILAAHPDAVSGRFIERFADGPSYEAFADLAREERFAPDAVAARIAPEPALVERLAAGIVDIAARLARPGSVPINVPSVGLSQTSGIVAHCLWGNVLAMVGKFGLAPGGTPLGGTVRIPGQINAESEVQGLSRKYFMGRIPIDRAAEAATRMGLPADAYDAVAADEPRAALDYSEPTPGRPELFLFFGTQFEANMMGRPRWLAKLESPDVRFVLVDPIAEPYALERAELILPSPPHPATTKLYQNGEWRLSLSAPQKEAPPETRSDATILYDVMAEIARRVERDPAARAAHPDLARHSDSGLLARRFAPPGLARIEGEVSRPQLWDRVQEYMAGGSGPLYCRPEHDDGRPIEWAEILEAGSLVYGGVGTTRFVLDPDDPDAVPFRDIFRQPGRFRFFLPTADDLAFATGIVLNSGRSTLSDDRDLVRFATATFNSGKATAATGMPDDNPLHVSPSLAGRLGLATGGWARATCLESGASEVFPVVVSDRVKGETVYLSFHKSRATMEVGRCVNTITSHVARCPYSGQTEVKCTPIGLEPAPAPAGP